MLYLHIGTEKAGSTTIQNFLGSQVELAFGYQQLEAFGLGNAWKLAAAIGTPLAYDYWVVRRGILSETEFKQNGNCIWKEVRKRVEESDCDTFVASSEYIYSHFERNKKEIEKLKQRLQHTFGEIIVIIYVRNQVSFLKSIYAQMVIGPNRTSESFDNFTSNFQNYQNMWDYASALKLWSHVFSENNIRVVMFDVKAFKEGSLIKDFLYRIDAENDFSVDVNTATKIDNKSPTYKKLNLVRFANMIPTSPTYELPYEVLRKIALSEKVRLKDRGFPTKYDKQIIDKVSDGNRWVNERFLDQSQIKLPVNR